MRKLILASIMFLASVSATFADSYPRHHYRGNNNGAIIGGVIGGLLIGGLIGNAYRGDYEGRYYDEPSYGYYPRCRTYFEGNYWNGYELSLIHI